MGIIRTMVRALAGEEITEKFSQREYLGDVTDYFNRVDDGKPVREKEILRYGIDVKTAVDPTQPDAINEYYERKSFVDQVESGQVEAMSIGFGTKVINAHSTLFSEPGVKYTLENDEVENVEKADELLERNRKAGGFQNGMVRADKLSLQCGSSVVFVPYSDGSTQYHYFSPEDIVAVWHQTITENGEVRAVDRKDPEDATYIIIRLGPASTSRWNYLAIFGRSDIYEQGRQVLYIAGDTCEVPKPYAKNVVHETEIGGAFGNPLSWLANDREVDSPDVRVPEYPITIIHSSLTDSKSAMMPITTSLYDSCVEFSVAASHTLSASQNAASGTRVLETTAEGNTKPIPKSLNGTFRTFPGQKVANVDHDSASITVSYQTMKQLMVDMAAGYSVPDYMISSEDHTMDASSGIALEIKSKPLVKFREFRVMENESSITRLFDIEKAQIYLFSEDIDADLLFTCKQEWDAGELRMPENKKEVAERISMLKSIGVLDEIAAIQEYYHTASEAEAIEIYERMAERATEYPPLIKEEKPKPALGLQGRKRSAEL